MVESQQELDDNTYYDCGLDEEDGDLPKYLTAGYLNECMLYQNEDVDNIRNASALSNSSRPMSRLTIC